MANKNKIKLKKIKFKKIPVSVELYNNSIKLAGGVFSKKGPIFSLIKKEFFSKENDDIFKEIAHLFRIHKFPSKSVFLNIPRHLVMARLLHLPSTSDDEIRNMVKMESAKQMPYRDEDIIIGYKIIEKLKNGYSDVLLAIAQEGIIKRLINTLRGADLTIEKIILGSESLFGWYSVIRESRKEKPEYNIALINIDSEYIGIDIMEKEKLVFTRGFSYEGKDSYVGKNAVDEIKKSIATCRKERKLNVDKIFISGAKNRIKVIEPILKEELGIPVDLIEQARNIELDKSIETDLAEASFIELIGLSLKNKDMKINLLPESMIEDNQLRFLKKSLMKTFVLLISIILIFSGIIFKKIFDKSRYLLLLNSRIKAIEPKVIKTRRMRENIKIIKNVIRKKPLAIDIVTEIYKITPQGITFNLLDYKSDKSLILRGDAPSLDSIIKFISILEKSQYFEDVKIKYTRKRSAAGTQLTDFEIICLLSKIN